jgi:hypothetical protein
MWRPQGVALASIARAFSVRRQALSETGLVDVEDAVDFPANEFLSEPPDE